MGTLIDTTLGCVINGTSMAASITGPKVSIQGIEELTCYIKASSATHVGVFQLFQSFDGTNWVSVNYPNNFKPRFDKGATNITVTSTTARNSTVLPPGAYIISANCDCHVKQGGSSITAATTDFMLKANTEYPLKVTAGATDGYVAGITPSAAVSGTLQILPDTYVLAAASSAAVEEVIDLRGKDIQAPFLRLDYTATSGVGTLYAYFHGKRMR